MNPNKTSYKLSKAMIKISNRKENNTLIQILRNKELQIMKDLIVQIIERVQLVVHTKIYQNSSIQIDLIIQAENLMGRVVNKNKNNNYQRLQPKAQKECHPKSL